MHIDFSPQVRDDKIFVARMGDTLAINGTEYDFTDLPEGGVLPASAVGCEFVIGNVTRIAGSIRITILLPIPADAPTEACFPQPIINPPDGRIQLPGGDQ